MDDVNQLLLLLAISPSFLLLVANGSYGVIIPQDCRCTLLKKNHDFTIFRALSNQWAMKKSKNAPKLNISFTETVTQFDGNAIFVIRNPFKAIISYRNFEFGVMSGMAPSDAFNHSLKLIQGDSQTISSDY